MLVPESTTEPDPNPSKPNLNFTFGRVKSCRLGVGLIVFKPELPEKLDLVGLTKQVKNIPETRKDNSEEQMSILTSKCLFPVSMKYISCEKTLIKKNWLETWNGNDLLFYTLLSFHEGPNQDKDGN